MARKVREACRIMRSVNVRTAETKPTVTEVRMR